MLNFIRRHPFIFILITLLLLVIIGIVLLARTSVRRDPLVYVNEALNMINPLPIPAVLAPEIINGEQVFKLNVQSGQTEFQTGIQTTTSGYNGSYLGPTLRATTGTPVRVQVSNQLAETTTVHWHGMEVPAEMDGGPHQTIAPNETWEANWTVTNPASTLWYHPHPLGKTATQVYSGLAGLFYIDDAASKGLGIPQTYGIDDIPVVVQDRKFDTNGQFVYDHDHSAHNKTGTAGMLGDTILVNGALAPYIELPAQWVRLRLVNGSNARRYNFGFENDQPFYQIATDGGLLSKPVERTRLLLTPGERAEIMVDLSQMTAPLLLLSYNVEDVTTSPPDGIQDWLLDQTDEDQQFKILELRPIASSNLTTSLPDHLVDLPTLERDDQTTERTFVMQANTINSLLMDHARIDQVVQQGATEIWTVRNESAIYHPFHIHAVQFKILDRDGEPAPDYEQGWKDTVNVDPGESVRLIMKFNVPADSSNPFMYHCHILEHEDMGMMGQFIVAADAAATPTLDSSLDTPHHH